MKEYLTDLTRVGPDKPMGYLPCDTIERLCGTSVPSIANALRMRGLYVAIYAQSECRVGSGAVYAADLEALGILLSSHARVLDAAGWSSSPREFLDSVASKGVGEDEDPDLYRLIGLAFADARFKSGPAPSKEEDR